jgi:uncharacterized coiled-coil DUF342 family protein
MTTSLIVTIAIAVITIIWGILEKLSFMTLKSIKDNQTLLLDKIAEVIENQGKFVHITKCERDMKSCAECIDKITEDFNKLEREFVELKTKIGFWHGENHN